MNRKQLVQIDQLRRALREAWFRFQSPDMARPQQQGQHQHQGQHQGQHERRP